ncbi:hypothetical protein GIB67_023818 [Kingdonia uniflora]|uniref:DUF4283 domain-containing protein n=1 Tax=Kingdonia uniflora TaxID=39325 RepID=A0A7J7NGU3_9MAGN|nr:hypothetical protein GIB67_023818 [Kingdonia uniflora]
MSTWVPIAVSLRSKSEIGDTPNQMSDKSYCILVQLMERVNNPSPPLVETSHTPDLEIKRLIKEAGAAVDKAASRQTPQIPIEELQILALGKLNKERETRVSASTVQNVNEGSMQEEEQVAQEQPLALGINERFTSKSLISVDKLEVVGINVDRVVEPSHITNGECPSSEIEMVEIVVITLPSTNSSCEVEPESISSLPIDDTMVEPEKGAKSVVSLASLPNTEKVMEEPEGHNTHPKATECGLEERVSGNALATNPIVEEPESSGKISEEEEQDLNYIKPDLVNDEVAIKVKPDEFKEGIKNSCQYLVGRRLAYPFVKDTLKKIWEIRGEFEMTIQGLDVFFKFSCEEDRNKTLEIGTQHIEMWVIIKNIPYQMRSEEGLARIASTLGTPLYPDRSNKQIAKVYAHFFYGEGQNSNGIFQYAWIPICCHHCEVFGHSSDTCDVAPKTITRSEEVSASRATESKNAMEDEEGFLKPHPKKTVKANVEATKVHNNIFEALGYIHDEDKMKEQEVIDLEKNKDVSQDIQLDQSMESTSNNKGKNNYSNTQHAGEKSSRNGKANVKVNDVNKDTTISSSKNKQPEAKEGSKKDKPFFKELSSKEKYLMTQEGIIAAADKIKRQLKFEASRKNWGS